MGKSIGALRARAKAKGLGLRVRRLDNGQISITGRRTNIRANNVNSALRLLGGRRNSYGTNF